MAVYKRDMVDINLETGNIHRSFLKHSIGFKDQQADHFGIRAYRNGEPVNLTGVSIQGIFMPPQGSPIAITSGNIVNYNEAEVVLPQACYNYDGQFTLAIKLVDPSNAVTGTMRIVDGMVDNTNASGTVAPVAAIPSYQEVLSTYEQAIAAINKTVRFDAVQSLTDTQKATARGNISAPSVADLQAETTAREAADTAINNAIGTVPSGKTVQGQIDTLESGKVPKTTTVNGHALSADVTVTKGDVGLGNVDNTSDANKPISTAQAAVNTQVSNIIGNTSLPTTAQTLTGAIAEHEGDLTNQQGQITDLKSAIKATGTEELTFEQGNISSSTGGNTSSSTRIRTPGYYACPFGFSFTVPTGFKAYLYYYSEQTAESKTGTGGEWKTGDIAIDAIHGNYMRIVVAKSNDASINPSDITSAISITMNKVSDKTLTQEDKAADAKTVGDKIQMITSDANAMKNGIFRDVITFTIAWTYGEGVTAADGSNYSTDKACRTGFTSFDVPFVVNMNDTDYEYLMWVYRNNSASYRTYSPTEQKFVQGLTLVNPNVGLNSMYKICFRRVDRAALTTDTTDPESDASKIIAALSFYEMTDKTLTKTGYPADSEVVGIEIANINNLILFESVPEYTVKNGNINVETGMNTSVNKTKRIRVDGNSPHQKMPTYGGIKVVVPSGKKLYAYKYSNDTYTEGYEGGIGWLDPGTYTFAEYVYYRFVIAFADDSAIDPEDVGDVIITNVSMTDETLTQKGKPADAYIVGDKLSNLQVFDNLSWGMANVIANSEQVKSVKWTPVGNMPRLGDGNGYFPLTEQTGLPYSSVRDQDKAIGMDVSIHTFMTAVKDPNSVLYTRKSTVSNSACYYGTVCSGMINVAMGYNLDLTNYYLSESDMFETVPMQSITEGDMIWVDGHCALVLKARRDSFGRINEVTVREEWPPLPRDVTYNSWESFLSKRPGYIARRFKDIAAVPYTAIPYVQNFDEEPEEIIYPDVQTEFGDAAVFMSGEDVKINVIDEKDYSYIVVTKDGETVQTVTTIESFTIENVEPGLYTITAVGAVNESVSTFFVVDATASFNTGTGVVTFSSTNAEPVLVNVYNLPNNRRITCKPIILTDADREAGQINVSEYMDEDYQYAKVTFKTQYGTAVWYSESHSKWNPIT